MRTILTILSITLLAGIATWFFPWWMIAVVPFLVVVFASPRHPFWTGFAGIALLWLLWILFHDIPNEQILSTRMAKVFSLPAPILLIIINILLGGVIGGMGAWSAAKMSTAFRRRKA